MTDNNEQGQPGWVPLAESGVWVPRASTEGPPGPPALPPTGPPPPPSDWWMGATPGGPPFPSVTPPAPNRRGRTVRAAATVAVVALAGAVGLGLGHGLWPDKVVSVNASSSQGSSNAGSSGTGSSGTGSSNSGGSNGSPFGQLPSGSFGGSGSSGESPFGGFGGGGSGQSPFGASGGSGTSNSSGGSSSNSDPATSAIAAKVSPDLVDINSTFGYQSASGAGTGIVLTSNGEVLTNNHVINGATTISVTDIGNGKTYGAHVVGYDASHDVAILQLQGASGLQVAKTGNSSNAAVGDSVVAIGNAGGTGGTPSNAGGSITDLNQSITASDDLDGTNEQLSGLIETNADIQPGDSGGALVNSSGQVIGMNTAASQGVSFDSAGDSGTQGFAIPIDEALSLAHNIESGKGSSTTHVGATGFLGLDLSVPSSSGQGGSNGVFGNQSGNGSGVTISGVVSGGPGAEAGLAQGDTITSVDGQSVNSPTDISASLVPDHPGDKVQVSWIDSSGQSHTSTVILGSGPPA